MEIDPTEVKGFVETCVACGRALEPGAVTCRACGTFVARPEAGRLVGAGARLGAWLLEGVLSLALAWVILAVLGSKLGFGLGTFFLGFVCYWAINFYFCPAARRWESSC